MAVSIPEIAVRIDFARRNGDRVVGGGIGWLFAANALVRRGIEAAVYELAPKLGEIGAGVLLTPNSVRQLERLEMGRAVEER